MWGSQEVYSWVDVSSSWKKILPAIPKYSKIAGSSCCCCLDPQCSSFSCPATLWHSEQSGEQFSSMRWWPLEIREGSWPSPLRLLQRVLRQRSELSMTVQLPATAYWGHPQNVCQELVLTSQLSNTGARLPKWGAEIPQNSAPRQESFTQNRYRVRIATICKLTDTNAKAVVLHLLVAVIGNKQCISLVLK